MNTPAIEKEWDELFPGTQKDKIIEMIFSTQQERGYYKAIDDVLEIIDLYLNAVSDTDSFWLKALQTSINSQSYLILLGMKGLIENLKEKAYEKFSKM